VIVNAPRPSHAQLRNLPIFSGCTQAQLDEIDSLADEVHIPAGRTLMAQGELGQEFALVVQGEADIVKDGRAVARIGPGAYFGEIALIDSVVRTASVVAVTDLVLEVIDRRGFNTLLDDVPTLPRSMLKGLAKRMAELESELHDLKAGQQ